ncbi:MAG: hypothetical protein ACI4MF_03030 [Candidatus Faecivicinus sp.]
MNKWIASLLVLCLMLSMNLALAETAPIGDQLADIVTCAQDQAELSYEYGAE